MKKWDIQEIEILKNNFSISSKQRILELLPNKTYFAITKKAYMLKLQRPPTQLNLKILICRECNKIFDNKANLERHLKIHSYPINKIKELAKRGYSSTDIGNILNVKSSTIRYICKLNNISLFKNKKVMMGYFLNKLLTPEKLKEFENKTSDEIMVWYNSQVEDHIKLAQSESIRKLKKQYGIANPVKIKKDLLNSITKEKIESLYTKDTTLYEISKNLGIGESSLTNLKNKFGIPTIRGRNDSSGQKELNKFLDTLKVNFLCDAYDIIDNFELDFYFPDHKIAVEYCGLYWHCNLYKENYYHRLKYDLCKIKGIRLITIFEDEWVKKRAVCESRLKNALNLIENKIYAKECILKEITEIEVCSFLEENHIQGKTNAIISFGLFFKDILVYVASLEKINQNCLELKRSCPKINFSVIGGFSKLLKECIRYCKKNNIIQIRSYCDLRWNTGNSYNKLGFKKTNEISYTSYYIKGINRYSKTKEELKKQIFDCGYQTWDLFFEDNLKLDDVLDIEEGQEFLFVDYNTQVFKSGTSKKYSPKWSRKELLFLKENYFNTSRKDILLKLCNRSWRSVHKKSKSLSLKRNPELIKKEKLEATIQTNMANFGVPHTSQREDVKNKAKSTNLKRYNVENVFQSKVIQEDIRQTNLKRYNVPRPMQNEVIKEKQRNTCFDRFNVYNVSKSEEIKVKISQKLKSYHKNKKLMAKKQKIV